MHALEICDDEMLYLAINLAFSCSLRIGEMLGLTWDCVEISEESIRNGEAYIFVNKELQRASRDAMEALDDKDVIFKFPPALKSTHTCLLLKTPKTKTFVVKYIKKSFDCLPGQQPLWHGQQPCLPQDYCAHHP